MARSLIKPAAPVLAGLAGLAGLSGLSGACSGIAVGVKTLVLITLKPRARGRPASDLQPCQVGAVRLNLERGAVRWPVPKFEAPWSLGFLAPAGAAWRLLAPAVAGQVGGGREGWVG
jgi:hypothetical protein